LWPRWQRIPIALRMPLARVPGQGFDNTLNHDAPAR